MNSHASKITKHGAADVVLMHTSHLSGPAPSIVVLLGCFVLMKVLEDDEDDTGYWPLNPKA
jgi:hypothetical protein